MLPFRRKKNTTPPESKDKAPATREKPRPGLIGRLRNGLKRTGSGIGLVFMGRKYIDADLLEELETLLLTADVGMEATNRIIGDLTDRLKRNKLDDISALHQALRENMMAILEPVAQPLEVNRDKKPMVILTVGINGAGKTTTIGKLAEQYRNEGRRVVLAAGDTFRAAAVEQLQAWGERTGTPVISQPTGSDAASVVYDAHQAAIARGADVLIADTAGRLHTQSNLMDELRKIRRVLGKQDETAPHEVLLVLDAGTGQNALAQAEQFREAVDVTGLALTKLDGTAKGGVIFAMAQRFGIPVRFIGIGEGVDDLRPFDAEAFVDALLDEAIAGSDEA
ncbi:signal recognition particle-docking protein FtsY [Spiribacter vilamensis]|uniref:Signal recognition particle receptor FtsY n=1 Tax=Spiribacter vilamensis TaxID=531306 RepID=A0A4Q8D1U6_9GAMM|nr:signal recognition particle-docking protein FtsY [Spiribacter vilamensis]RZU99318.1 signal recognition particle-docking protein FtsY [Spiribacter vilamensis]TVO61698.1 signal recognition particle-docking protein FtsY [Spiribacter vilamensis]